MSKQEHTLSAILDIVNDIKKTGFTLESVDQDSYLGGELGIDSMEMLEIWYEIEQHMHIRVNDAEKRDLYTLGDVVALVERKLEAAAEPARAVA